MADALNTLLNTLTQAVSQDPRIMKPAEQQLIAWETNAGFYSMLYDIISRRDLKVETRMLAVMIFKNRVDKYWRKEDDGPISAAEKANIRSKLLSAVTEPANHIAMQEAVLIGKIARHDVPMEWPSLVPDLLKAVKQGEGLQRKRAVLILYRVCKALASRRLSIARTLFRQMTAEMFQSVTAMWLEMLDPPLQNYSPNLNTEQINLVSQMLDHARTLLKLLRVMLVHGVSEYDKLAHIVEFFKSLVQRHTALVHLRENMGEAHVCKIGDVVDKTIVLMNKIYLCTQTADPTTFAPLLGIVFPFVLEQVVTGKEPRRRQKLERSVILSMTLIIQILKCDQYVPNQGIRFETARMCLTQPTSKLLPERLRAIDAATSVFTSEVQLNLLQVLLTQYFVLTQDDLEQWSSSPEEFAFVEIGEAWKFSLRPCAENLYCTLLKNFKGFLGPAIITAVKNVLGTIQNNSDGILQKEAAYSMLCVNVDSQSAASELYDVLDFDALFTTTLVEELQTKDVENKLIRRRVCAMVGQWTSVRFDRSGKLGLRSILYQLLVQLLGAEEDLVVRITALTTLRDVVDDFGFEISDIVPHVNAIMMSLFKLLIDVEQCDSKMNVLDMITMLVDRMGSTIKEFSTSLAQYLPGLWETSGESAEFGMLRTAIVRSFIKLVDALGSDSPGLYDFLCTVVLHSIDTTQPHHVYLLQDGLELWHRTVQFAPCMSEKLVQLSRCLFPLLEIVNENIKQCLLIMESYIILGGAFMLETYGTTFMNVVTPLIGQLPPDGAMVLCQCVDVILYGYTDHGCVLAKGFLSALILNIMQGADAVVPKHGGLYAAYMMVLTRIIFLRPEYFLAVCNGVSTHVGQDILPTFFDYWIDKYDVISNSRTRKLSVLAMLQCLGYQQFDAMTHPRFPLILNTITNGLHQFHIHGAESLKVDYLVQFFEKELQEDDVDAVLTTEPARKRKLSKQDCICTVNLKGFVESQFQAMRVRLGPQHFTQLWNSVDSTITHQLEQFLNSLQ